MADAGIAPEWRECKGFPSFEVSSDGQVRRKGRPPSKLQPNPLGYVYAYLGLVNGRQPKKLVHVLVAEAFLGERPEGFEVDHIDRNRANNCAANLRWLPWRENRERRVPRGTYTPGTALALPRDNVRT